MPEKVPPKTRTGIIQPVTDPCSGQMIDSIRWMTEATTSEIPAVIKTRR